MQYYKKKNIINFQVNVYVNIQIFMDCLASQQLYETF